MAPAATLSMDASASAWRAWPRPSPKKASLEQCLTLALLLHVLLILVIGNEPGGEARRTVGAEGPLRVTLRGTDADRDRGLIASPWTGAAADLPVPTPAAEAHDAGRRASAKPSRDEAGSTAVRVDAPAAVLAPPLPTAKASLPAPQSVPDAAPQVVAPSVEQTTESPPVPVLQTAPRPAEVHVPPTTPAEPTPPVKTEPGPVPVSPAQPPPIPTAPKAAPIPAPATPATPTLAPVEDKPRPAPGASPTTEPVQTPQQPSPTPASTPAPTPTSPPSREPLAGPDSAASPTAGSGANPDAATRDAAQPASPASGERPLNLDLHPRIGPTLGRGSMGLLPVLPSPPERKSKLGEDIDKAAKSDCRTAYSGAGVLAVVPLAIDAVRDKGCHW
jgi:hypothetical protein